MLTGLPLPLIQQILVHLFIDTILFRKDKVKKDPFISYLSQHPDTTDVKDFSAYMVEKLSDKSRTKITEKFYLLRYRLMSVCRAWYRIISSSIPVQPDRKNVDTSHIIDWFSPEIIIIWGFISPSHKLIFAILPVITFCVCTEHTKKCISDVHRCICSRGSTKCLGTEHKCSCQICTHCLAAQHKCTCLLGTKCVATSHQCICYHDTLTCRMDEHMCTCHIDQKKCRSIHHLCVCPHGISDCSVAQHKCSCLILGTSLCKSSYFHDCSCECDAALCRGRCYHKCSCVVSALCRFICTRYDDSHACACAIDPKRCKSKCKHVCSCSVDSSSCKMARFECHECVCSSSKTCMSFHGRSSVRYVCSCKLSISDCKVAPYMGTHKCACITSNTPELCHATSHKCFCKIDPSICRVPYHHS